MFYYFISFTRLIWLIKPVNILHQEYKLNLRYRPAKRRGYKSFSHILISGPMMMACLALVVPKISNKLINKCIYLSDVGEGVL